MWRPSKQVKTLQIGSEGFLTIVWPHRCTGPCPCTCEIQEAQDLTLDLWIFVHSLREGKKSSPTLRCVVLFFDDTIETCILPGDPMLCQSPDRSRLRSRFSKPTPRRRLKIEAADVSGSSRSSFMAIRIIFTAQPHASPGKYMELRGFPVESQVRDDVAPIIKCLVQE